MCRNHSHARVNSNQGGEMPDGTVVHIAELTNAEFTLEFSRTGEKLTVPRCKTLLLLATEQDTAFFSPQALMVALSALWSVLAEKDGAFMTTMPWS